MAKYTAGQVSAALWENEISTGNGKQATMLKATLQKRFKDRDGAWKSSTSLNRNEIPLAVYCLNKCFQFMIEEQRGSDDGDSVEEEIVM